MRDFDEQIYESTRAQFEYLLLRAVEPGQNRESVMADVAVLLTCFNNATKSCQSMAKQIKELKNV